jgi:hypothetical protein
MIIMKSFLFAAVAVAALASGSMAHAGQDGLGCVKMPNQTASADKGQADQQTASADKGQANQQVAALAAGQSGQHNWTTASADEGQAKQQTAAAKSQNGQNQLASANLNCNQ